MNKVIPVILLPLLLTACGITRIVTVAPAPAQTVVVAQQQPQVVYTQPVSTTVTYPRTNTTRTTTIEVTPLTSDISLYLDLQAIAAAFAQAYSVEEFEMILNSQSYIISNLDLNHDGYIDYLRVLETLDGRTHVMLIQAVLAANIYQDVATLVVEMGYATPYVQIIGSPYVYGANYIIEPVFYKRPPLFDRFGRPTYTYWRSPYYWDHFPHQYAHHAPYHLGHYQAYVATYMQNHHYCHSVNYVDHYHYQNYVEVSRPISRGDYEQQYPEQSFSRRTTATYVPSGSQTATRVTNARQLRQAVEQSGATRTTTSTRTSGTSATQTTPARSSGSATTSGSTTSSSSRTTTSSATTTSSSSRTTPAQQSTSTRSKSTQSSSTPARSTTTTTTRVRTSGTTSTRSSGSSTGTRTSGTSTSTRSSGTSTGTRGSSSTDTRSTGTSTRR